MPEQAVKEVQADAILKEALQESQIRNIRLWSIESCLRDEIDELKQSSLTPKHAQKASMLKSALTLVAGVKKDGEEEQEKFEEEIEEGGERV